MCSLELEVSVIVKSRSQRIGKLNSIQARSFMYNYRNICCEKHFISFFVIGYFWAVKHGQGNKPIDLNWTKTDWFQLIEINLRPKSTRVSRGFQKYFIRNSYCSLFEYCMLCNATLYVSERISVSLATLIALLLFFFFKNGTVLVSAILFISLRP